MDEDKQQSWHFKSRLGHVDDPLLKCLVIITKLHDHPHSEAVLSSGLPLVEGRLTPSLFVRAANRAKLSAKILKRSLKEINPLALPAVLLMKNKQACILNRIENNVAHIIQPETGTGVAEIDVDKLEENYTGYVIYVSPQYEFHARDTDPDERIQFRKNWFWDTVMHHWSSYGEVLLASFLINLFALATPLFIMGVYDRVVPNFAFETLTVLTVGIFIIIIFDLVMRLLRGYFIDSAGKNIDVVLSANIFEKLLGLKLEERPRSIGTMSNTIQSFETFRDLITSASISIFLDMPFAILFLVAIWYLGGSIVWVPLIAMPIIILVSILTQAPLNRNIKKMFHYAAMRQSLLVESLNGPENIKAISAESALQEKWENIVREAARLSVKVHFLSNLSVNVAVFVQYATTLLVVVLGVYGIAAGSLSIGALIACTILTGRALTPMGQFATLIARYFQSKTALSALDKIMRSEVDRADERDYLHREDLSGEIEFRDVKFHYPDQSYRALEGINFSVKPGEKVGIVGRVGSGKSTLAKLLVGFYNADSGHILLDQTDVQQIDPADIRRNIAYVPQNVMLFNGTVKDNIVYGSPYVDDETILEASRVAGVDDFVKITPEGYDLQVGEKGARISSGQRQTIAIARAMLLNPPILLLDEPTNAMDEQSERNFINKLKGTYNEKTVILITHRATTLKLVDRLIVVDMGQIVADGPRDEVLRALQSTKRGSV